MPYTQPLEKLSSWSNAGIDITSSAMDIDGVEGAELGNRLMLYAVPMLLIWPDDVNCFLFLVPYFFELNMDNEIQWGQESTRTNIYPSLYLCICKNMMGCHVR